MTCTVLAKGMWVNLIMSVTEVRAAAASMMECWEGQNVSHWQRSGKPKKQKSEIETGWA